ncbi:MAG: uracil-DNA glycosylase family protein [Candidatus Thorarchaeota archaeon]|jgi:uracil-DNA glycosylase
MSRKREIEKLLDDIRECKDCKEVVVKKTPLVYSARNPKILIVSDTPPFTEWIKNLGDAWRTTLKIPEKGQNTSTNLLDWLSTPDRRVTIEDADNHFFWIQRCNCCLQKSPKDEVPEKKKLRVYLHCSKNYIERAIDVVKPLGILSLGGYASRWFVPRKTITEVAGNEKYTSYKGYDYCALAHPSPKSTWPADNPEKHKRSLACARRIIEKLPRES